MIHPSKGPSSRTISFGHSPSWSGCIAASSSSSSLSWTAEPANSRRRAPRRSSSAISAMASCQRQSASSMIKPSIYAVDFETCQNGGNPLCRAASLDASSAPDGPGAGIHIDDGQPIVAHGAEHIGPAAAIARNDVAIAAVADDLTGFATAQPVEVHAGAVPAMPLAVYIVGSDLIAVV